MAIACITLGSFSSRSSVPLFSCFAIKTLHRSSLPPASLFFLGALPGTLVSGPLIARFGSKRLCLLAAGPLAAASWAVMLLADGVAVACGARLVAGISYGFILSTGKEQEISADGNIVLQSLSNHHVMTYIPT